MSIVAWIVVGLIWGLVASRKMTGTGAALNVELSIIGAVLAGDVFTTFGMAGASGLNVYSMLAALAGAMVVPLLHHAFNRSQTTAPLVKPSLSADDDGLRPGY